MRKWLFLLLLPTWTWAAQVNVTRCWAPDGPYVPVADTATKCPAQLTNGSADTVTSTSFNATVITSKSTGTLYFYPSTSSTPPSRKHHIAGTGAAATLQTVSVSASGAQSVAITGLSIDAQYYIHVLDITTGGRPSNRVTISQRTSASSPPSTVTVEGFFWGTGGSDLNSGSTHAARFASLEPISSMSGVATGTDIWGLAGSTHTVTTNERFTTKWAGDGGNPAYIASYYIDGSTPTATWEGSQAGTLTVTLPTAASTSVIGAHTLPSINGALTDACIAANNCSWQVPITNECTSGHDAIVKIRHDHVWWFGMKVEESTCRGMDVGPGTTTIQESALVGFRMRYSVVEQTGQQGLIMISGVAKSLVQDSIGRYLQVCAKSKARGGTSPSGSSIALTPQNGCDLGGSGFIYHSSLNSYSGFYNNTVILAYGETIHCLKSSYILFRGNRLGNNMRTSLYHDVCGNSISERNLVWGTVGNAGDGPGTVSASNYWGGTPDHNAEFNQWNNSAEPTLNLSRANIYIGASQCASYNLSATAVAGLEPISGKFYHNTCIANNVRSISAGNNLNATVNEGIDMKNNVFASPTTSNSDVCSTDTAGNYNVFAKQPVAACRGANDIASSASTDTLLTLPVGTGASPNSTNIATWRAYDYLNPPVTANAAPTAGTHTGTRLNNVQCISDAEVTEWQTILDWIGGITTSSWKMCASEYYDGEAIANTPVIGALAN